MLNDFGNNDGRSTSGGYQLSVQFDNDTDLKADKETTYPFAIVNDSAVVGSIGVFRCSNIHYRTAEMGIMLQSPIGIAIGIFYMLNSL